MVNENIKILKYPKYSFIAKVRFDIAVHDRPFTHGNIEHTLSVYAIGNTAALSFLSCLILCGVISPSSILN